MVKERLLTRREAAAYLGLNPDTLAAWACTGRYRLPVVKVGRCARYRRADLEAWLAARTVCPAGEVEGTGETTGAGRQAGTKPAGKEGR